jgi:hypothetical protein
MFVETMHLSYNEDTRWSKPKVKPILRLISEASPPSGSLRSTARKQPVHVNARAIAIVEQSTAAGVEAEREGDLRVIDESGEDYLFPKANFVLLDVPPSSVIDL